ncbi:MAG: hypothetical protein ACYS7Y_29320 [Planctomycetota bacterium]
MSNPRRKRIGRRGPAGMKPRKDIGSPEAIAALEVELAGVEYSLTRVYFVVEREDLETRRAELLGELKRLRSN